MIEHSILFYLKLGQMSAKHFEKQLGYEVMNYGAEGLDMLLSEIFETPLNA